MDDSSDLQVGRRKDLLDLELERILEMVNTDNTSIEHEVASEFNTRFTWNYEKGQKPQLHRLYEKSKSSMWDAETDLPWNVEVDQEAIVVANALNRGGLAGGGLDLKGTPCEAWTEEDWIRFGIEGQNWTLSQFLHGEQGALVCTARIVETVPWIDAKYYAASQVYDEARHVEVFGKYLDVKLSGHYPINTHLKLLLDDILSDTRWDVVYLGMQVMVEGLALAAFGYMRELSTEPLLKEVLRRVMSDEARHVAFGILSLGEFYKSLNAAEIRERQEFAYEAAVRMHGRFLQQEVFARMGAEMKDILPLIRQSQEPDQAIFQSALFSKIVPSCKRIGLLDAGDAWLRKKFTDLGVIAFENVPASDEETAALQIASGAQL